MAVYYILTIIANAISIVVFHNSINITELSAIPLILMVLMIFQANYFKNDKVENGFRTAYLSNLTDKEENTRNIMISGFMIACLPAMFPFIVFFSSGVKLLSVLVYLISFVGGAVLYRFKNR